MNAAPGGGPGTGEAEEERLVWPGVAAHFADLTQAGALPGLGVAVSGGGDSLALLVLLDDWRRRGGGPDLAVATVDHGLRADAEDEAGQVGAFCARFGLAHDTLHWRGWDGRGNLQDAARRARYGLLAEWAASRGLAHVALAHTADDLAETLLMRLARRAGLDGLSAMAARSCRHGVTFHRPALHLQRAELRALLRARGIGWAEDPSNADPAFARVRARQVLAALAPLGLDADDLATVARRLSDDRDTIRHYVAQAGGDLTRMQGGDLLIARDGFAALPVGVARRLLVQGLRWIGGAEYAPRAAPLDALVQGLRCGQGGGTLAGCLITMEDTALRIAREAQAVAGLRGLPGAAWDGRWRMVPPAGMTLPEGAEVAALGDAGLAELGDAWRQAGVPRSSARALPAAWRGGDLLAAPLTGHPASWRADLMRDHAGFLHALAAADA